VYTKFDLNLSRF